MPFYKRKIELSPRLKFGIKKGHSPNQKIKFFTFLFLILAVILGLNAGRIVYNNSKPAKNNNAPEVLGANVVKTVPSDTQFIEYIVKKGDTLFNVSQKYNINWSTLATLNNLKSPFVLKPGQKIRIPK